MDIVGYNKVFKYMRVCNVIMDFLGKSSRRNFLELIGLEAIALSVPAVSFGQGTERIRLHNDPLDYCDTHFKQPPNSFRGEDGVTYQKIRDNFYSSDNGNVVRVDFSKPLRIDFEYRENSWEDALNGNPPNIMGPGEFSKSDLHQLNISLSYAKWDSLQPKVREKTKQAFESYDIELRKFICNTYSDVYKNFYLQLDETKRANFRMFVKAFRHAIQNATKEDDFSPQNKMFAARIGSVAECYDRHFPWLCLSLPNVSDRAMMFIHETNKHGDGERINWNYVRNYGV